MTRRQPGGTATSNFGVGRREGHDASAFYARFHPMRISQADDLAPPLGEERALVCADARATDLPDNSVALVVTSPPYFAGKEYEEAMGQGVIPATYVEYLQLLAEVFSECLRVLEPGGRIAVNVANLGRKPYRSLSSDVIRILDDDLGMLLRGEVIWQKAEGASGSCAWGSYRSPTNPVLRDVTERVIIASKGRFDRARDVETRRDEGRPNEATITTDEFLEATIDLWQMRPESARRVGHPAPFPVELPQRLIEMYTFRDDLVLDPFLGSGTTAVAAVRTDRRYVGYDTDASYVELARSRVAEEIEARAVEQERLQLTVDGANGAGVAIQPGAVGRGAKGEGRAALAMAFDMVEAAGFDIVGRDRKIPGLGLSVDLVAEDAEGVAWCFDVTGAFTSMPGGLVRAATLWKCLGRLSVLASQGRRPVVALSSHLPPRRSGGHRALRAVGPSGVHDVMGILDPDDRARLGAYACGGHDLRPLPGWWSTADLAPGHRPQVQHSQLQ